MPKIKLDLTRDEVLAAPPVKRSIAHPYSDAPKLAARVAAYSIEELMAEKLRALAERCRPRDLYDVINLYRHDLLDGGANEVARLLSKKCAHAGIQIPTLESVQRSSFVEDVQAEWENMLAHQLPHLPPFSTYWDELPNLFEWLAARPRPSLQRIQPGPEVDPAWSAARTMSSWGIGLPLEMVRFAGANRLKVLLDYRAKNGRTGPRLVEPYSLRRARNGALLLYVVNDRGQLRSYDVARIARARVTDEPFIPRYNVEF